MGAHPQIRGALCLLAESLPQVVSLSLWPWLPATGHDQQPSGAGSAAHELQEAGLKGDRKSWWGQPMDAETSKGSLAAPDSEPEEQACLTRGPSNVVCVPCLGNVVF